MDLELLRAFLGGCTLINLGVLVFWFLLLTLARSTVCGMARRWFQRSQERFEELHDMSMAYVKLAVSDLNLVPYLARRIVG